MGRERKVQKLTQVWSLSDWGNSTVKEGKKSGEVDEFSLGFV